MNNKAKENFYGFLYITPFLIPYVIFIAWPTIYSLIISFLKTTIFSNWYDVFGTMQFVGFDNYLSLLDDKNFWWSLIATAFYALLTIPTGIILSLLLAIVLNNKLKGVSFFRSAFFLPNVLDLLVVGIVWCLIFAPNYGLMDMILKSVGITYFSENGLLQNKYTVLPTIAFVLVLKSAGFGMILFLTAIQNIPQSVYEAADIDGASWFQKTINITVPLVKPIILFLTITGTIAVLNAFSEIYAMTNNTGGPAMEFMGETVRTRNISV